MVLHYVLTCLFVDYRDIFISFMQNWNLAVVVVVGNPGALD